jgi:hypothetical protein
LLLKIFVTPDLGIQRIQNTCQFVGQSPDPVVNVLQFGILCRQIITVKLDILHHYAPWLLYTRHIRRFPDVPGILEFKL